MLNRFREMAYAPHTGRQIQLSNGNITTKTVATGSSWCLDNVGLFPAPSPLRIEKEVLTPGLMTGRPAAFPVYEFDSYPYLNQPNMPVVPPDPSEPLMGWMGSTPPDDATAIAQVVESTIPTRPEVSVPNLLWEVFPLNMQKAGQLLKDHILEPTKPLPKRKKPGSNTVAEINFGWAQLFRDVAGLLRFADHVEKRDRELRSLYEKGGLRRKRVVWEGHSDYISAHNLTVNSFNCFVQVDRRTQVLAKRWVTVRWLYPIDRPIPTAPDRLQQARELVHGWSNAPARVWEALPWSWFIDYFAGIGGFLEVSNNSLGVFPTNICVCQTTETRITDTLVGTSPNFVVTPGSYRKTVKERHLGSYSLSIHWPIFSAKQLTTLAGIAANHGGVVV